MINEKAMIDDLSATPRDISAGKLPNFIKFLGWFGVIAGIWCGVLGSLILLTPSAEIVDVSFQKKLEQFPETKIFVAIAALIAMMWGIASVALLRRHNWGRKYYIVSLYILLAYVAAYFSYSLYRGKHAETFFAVVDYIVVAVVGSILAIGVCFVKRYLSKQEILDVFNANSTIHQEKHEGNEDINQQ